MLTLQRVAVFSACCTYCEDEVFYTVPDDLMPLFEQIDESCNHRPVCSSCDFYRQEDLLARFRRGDSA